MEATDMGTNTATVRGDGWTVTIERRTYDADEGSYLVERLSLEPTTYTVRLDDGGTHRVTKDVARRLVEENPPLDIVCAIVTV